MSRWWKSYDFVFVFFMVLSDGGLGEDALMADFEEGLIVNKKDKKMSLSKFKHFFLLF
jgi:hypothetical protein